THITIIIFICQGPAAARLARHGPRPRRLSSAPPFRSHRLPDRRGLRVDRAGPIILTTPRNAPTGLRDPAVEYFVRNGGTALPRRPRLRRQAGAALQPGRRRPSRHAPARRRSHRGADRRRFLGEPTARGGLGSGDLAGLRAPGPRAPTAPPWQPAASRSSRP